tara:strand:+ start:1021 stop:1482 length:462 start_codon:yes stop_codon:yes gene_type:complete
MPDYQNGKIYKLWSPQGEENEIYIGSTTDKLYKRKSHHKNHPRCSSKTLFEKYDDIRIEVIEEYPCNSKAELEKKEGEYIRTNKCLNKVIPGRTQKEYVEEHKEEIDEYKKLWSEKIVTCVCGCKLQQSHLNRHQKNNKHIKLMKEKNNLGNN